MARLTLAARTFTVLVQSQAFWRVRIRGTTTMLLLQAQRSGPMPLPAAVTRPDMHLRVPLLSEHPTCQFTFSRMLRRPAFISAKVMHLGNCVPATPSMQALDFVRDPACLKLRVRPCMCDYEAQTPARSRCLLPATCTAPSSNCKYAVRQYGSTAPTMSTASTEQWVYLAMNSALSPAPP